MPWEYRHGVCAGGRRQEEGREDLSSSSQTCEGWGGRDGGRDRRTPVFISWTMGPIEAVKQDTEKTAATGLSVERTEALGEHPAVRGEAFLLLGAVSEWLGATTLRRFQQHADSHSAVHSSSQSPSWKGHGPVLPGPDDRDSWLLPAGRV